MTPLGVVYRSFCYTRDEALKYSQWAEKLFGGLASDFYVVGPNQKGFYEAAILASVPPGAKCIKKPKDAVSEEWQQKPEEAYVLFDDTTTPLALYFDKRELLVKPKESPPLTAYCVVPAV